MPRLRLIIVLAFVWLVLTSLALQTYAPDKSTVERVFLNAAALFLVVAPLLIFTPINTFLRKLPFRHLGIMMLLVVCVLLGHLCGKSRTTFPFVQWDMYKEPVEFASFAKYQIMGQLENGQPVELNPARLMPALHNNFFVGLKHWGEVIHRSDNQDWELYSNVLEGLGHRYYEINPDSSLSQIQVIRQETIFDEHFKPHMNEEELIRVQLE